MTLPLDHQIVPRGFAPATIKAAGGVVFRGTGDGLEIACIYRSAREDWTFPKGKLDPGETFEVAALREVFEEIGFACEIESFIGATYYTHRKGKPKIVAYYLMHGASGEFEPNAEVDDLVWLPVGEVREHLTWTHDKELFDLVAEELRAR
jgi:8-oxo-dGTP diphosphatase